MADQNTIIEGSVKFRDGKKWKSRWCVMRKLSPVADCVQLQVYRDARARWAGAGCKASLSLQQYLGCEAGFTLDKHSHTLALVCADFTAVLAFDSRERLLQWQVKLQSQVGASRQWTVVARASGPARLLLRGGRAALSAGTPPKLVAVWELAHLRRYGVVEGRFCLEGGSLCAKSEGLHVLVTDQAAEIAREFHLASRGGYSPRINFAPKGNEGAGSPPPPHPAPRPPARLAELNTIDGSLPPVDLQLYENPCVAETDATSPYWPSTERINFQDLGFGDTASVNETVEGSDLGPWNGSKSVTLERCMSCMSKLGALSRSSTAALTPGAKHFNPAWTMDSFNENSNSYNGTCGNVESREAPPATSGSEELCRCPGAPPSRPPKPCGLELNARGDLPPAAPPWPRSRSHSHLSAVVDVAKAKVGPFENYDVPKLPSAEVEGEYYDTPKRLKESLNRDLFKITRSVTTDTLVLKKPCGCLLKLGKQPMEPTVIDTEESFQPVNCPCRRVTDWANTWIKLPYCRRDKENKEIAISNKENVVTSDSGRSALYATVDFSRKTKRRARPHDGGAGVGSEPGADSSRQVAVDDGPLANYENLSFALSLEHYENAKDLLRKAGITESELDAIGANLRHHSATPAAARSVCSQCGHPQGGAGRVAGVCAGAADGSNGEYLMMEPRDRVERDHTLAAGYTPMSPIGSFAFNTLKYPARSPISRLLEEKSASNPALCPDLLPASVVKVGSESQGTGMANNGPQRPPRGRRSSSVDSSRFLEDVEEFEDSVGSRGSASSMETLRGLVAGRSATPCGCSQRSKAVSASRGGGEALREGAGAAGSGGGGGARDSCSSNDSGVCSWSRRKPTRPPHAGEPPALTASDAQRGVTDAHSTSSGASDMSDYVETLSMCSSQSSSDTPPVSTGGRAASTLRPRAGPEYRPLTRAAPALTPVTTGADMR